MIELLGYVAAVVIGFTLGLIGGGGSILTVPVLVYLVGIKSVLSTAYSLFVVGAASLVGSITYMRRGLVSYPTALVFAIPSFMAVYVTRRWLLPAIPSPLAQWNWPGGADFLLTKETAIMLFFALIMVAAAASMIRTSKLSAPSSKDEVHYNYLMIVVEGVVVGILTGLVGAGGGFLIIPALVILAKLPMKLAIGTSLLIIAAKSLIGFMGDVGRQPIDWTFLLIFTASSILGIFIGTYASRYVAADKLKVGFGWLVLVMAAYILSSELIA